MKSKGYLGDVVIPGVHRLVVKLGCELERSGWEWRVVGFAGSEELEGLELYALDESWGALSLYVMDVCGRCSDSWGTSFGC